MTKQQEICSKLEARGLKRDNSARTSKYIVYNAGNGVKYFVGKNGALRKGKSIADSISLTGLLR